MLRLREATAGDLNFVVDSWRKSYADAAAVRGMHADDYYPSMGAKLQLLLARPDVQLEIIGPDDPDDDTILAWACTERDVLHYVYVRKGERGMGNAKTLLQDKGIARYSFRSSRVSKTPIGWKFDPFMGLMR